MCLYTRGKKRTRRAKRSIVVFKRLTRDSYFSRGGEWRTPFQHTRVFGDGILSAIGQPIQIEKDGDGDIRIDGGMIHAYTNFDKAWRNSKDLRDVGIVRGIIPKGTRYARGNREDIAAKMIILDWKTLKKYEKGYRARE